MCVGLRSFIEKLGGTCSESDSKAKLRSILKQSANDFEGEELDLSGFIAIDISPFISPLAECNALVTLILAETSVVEISPLAECTALDWLDLAESRVAEISPLAGCTALRVLNLRDTRVADISPLAECTALEWLNLYATYVTDISDLKGCA